MEQRDPEFRLTLRLAEINQILEILGQRPYAEVYSLIQKIQQQVVTQMQPPAESNPT